MESCSDGARRCTHVISIDYTLEFEMQYLHNTMVMNSK